VSTPDNGLWDELDARGYLGVSAVILNRLVKDSGLPHIALPNGDKRFQQNDLQRWVDNKRQPPQPDYIEALKHLTLKEIWTRIDELDCERVALVRIQSSLRARDKAKRKRRSE
jgi:hypothetical protein